MAPCPNVLVTDTWAQTPKYKAISPQLLKAKSFQSCSATYAGFATSLLLQIISMPVIATENPRQVSIFHLTEYTLILGFTVLPGYSRVQNQKSKPALAIF